MLNVLTVRTEMYGCYKHSATITTVEEILTELRRALVGTRRVPFGANSNLQSICGEGLHKCFEFAPQNLDLPCVVPFSAHKCSVQVFLSDHSCRMVLKKVLFWASIKMSIKNGIAIH